MKRALRARLDEWNDVIQQNVAEARQVLDAALTERIIAAPDTDEHRTPCWRLDVPTAWDRLLSRLVPDVMPGLQDRVASPNGFGDNLRQVRQVRIAA